MDEEILAQKYKAVFESTCHYLRQRIENDPDFTIEQLEGALRNACIRQGNDWIGYGVLQEAVNNAIVAAHEQVLADWKNKLAVSLTKEVKHDENN